MNLKQRTKPLPLQKLDAAIPRISPTFPNLPKMQADAKRRQQGYSGEKKVDYFLDNLTPKHTLLHDVYLRENNKNFQIDALVIAKNFISIVDSKNYSGTITFNTTLRHLTSADGEIESGFEYPITQVNNQKLHLQNWLNQHNLGHISIKCFVAIADPSTVVQVEGDQEEVSRYLVHAAELPVRILDAEQQLAKKHARKLSDDQIGKTILGECKEFDIDLFKRYGVRPSDILPGVVCPDCGLRGMRRIHSGWWCHHCQQKNYDAHQQALADYFLLIKNTLTNKECMWFLRLNKKGTATRILKKSEARGSDPAWLRELLLCITICIA